MFYGCQSMTQKIEKIVLKHPKHAFLSQENLEKTWKAFNYLEQPDYAKVLEEYKIFEDIILENVEDVLYLPESSEVGLDSIYTHDSVKITKEGSIFFNTGKVLRRNEANEMKKLLENNGIPTLGKIESPGKMEGGDILWIDEKTVAIGLGYRTNLEGINQFKALTKDFIEKYIIVPMPHGEGEAACLHLMSVISLISEKLAVVYSKYMPIFFREVLLNSGIVLIEVDDMEYDYLGSNVLALSPNKCVVMEGNPKIEQALKDKGCEVYTYPGHNLSYFGTGGPTCLTCPIFR
jgi:arginine deiminase